MRRTFAARMSFATTTIHLLANYKGVRSGPATRAGVRGRQKGAADQKKQHNTSMNKTVLSLACALAVSTAFAADEVVTSTTTTTSTGTLHEYTPGTTFVVKESSGPVKYKYGKKVTYVTKSGKTLSDAEVRTRIKVGAPISVHYSTEGDERVVTRVEIDD